jgi:Domain of unknown function (DUF4158)
MRFLYAREWVSAERPGVLFDLAITWLVDHKVVLPGITTLERLVSRIREQVALRVWQRLNTVVEPEQRIRLDHLLERSGKGNTRITTLERLRRLPTYASSRTMSTALARLDEIRQLGVGAIDLENISPSRIRTLATYAMTSKASTLARQSDDQRAATLLCCARALEVTALDDSLDVLDMLLRDRLAKSERKGKKERLRTLRDLDNAAECPGACRQCSHSLEHNLHGSCIGGYAAARYDDSLGGCGPAFPDRARACQCVREVLLSAFRVDPTGSISSATRTGRNRKSGGRSRGRAINRDSRNQLWSLAYIFVPLFLRGH